MCVCVCVCVCVCGMEQDMYKLHAVVSKGMKLQMPCNNVKLFLCTPWKFKGGGGLAPLILYLSKRRI